MMPGDLSGGVTGRTDDALTPDERARFDQQWAEVNRRLDAFVQAHREVGAQADAIGQTELFLIGSIGAVSREVDHNALAEMSMAALTRIARLEDRLIEQD